ncbi:SWI/SNF related-matrix-associated actin-dependent regulator ofchromatin subfamily C [Galdieria sulphuraria]|uniref:SWI/SNF related-matrix-associated actin-dependent regulator ofchromatin subfamily C n=1 Tax=Galdieria sulphuraria TaxID=130081 RepID=M2XMI1_GALSU|nr:SWI/SNF related-matrix-associated actin-dependent regulator ofchromatin subfamily C [Galdieria sulphuraria]EME31372.1 SWI/SNF related-matrix-associated actin-dependent regulator ofchromatin subfamily C [Galdieria sulphuraria]|eukprot:XP_005707892.1 SWI/SNF related-matrix-associated actin-dependent regulator ofchromatin subfamily C [Galdieria sulphuraria]
MSSSRSSPIKIEDFETPEAIQSFEAMASWMKNQPRDQLGFDASDITASTLARVTGELSVFLETNLGKNSQTENRIITKFPQHVFRHTQPDSALCKILCLCFQFKEQQAWRRLDALNPDRKEAVMNLLLDVEKNLRTTGILPPKKVFFSRSVAPSLVPKLKSIVQRHGGLVVSSATSATHIIEPDVDIPTDSEDVSSEEYCRVLKREGDKVFVHWWYYPDSYDSWIPASEVDGSEIDEQSPPKGPWHVQARFIIDLEKFNEWPNELDYEVPDDMITRTIADGKGKSVESEHGSQENRIDSNHDLHEDNIPDSRRKRKLNEASLNVKDEPQDLENSDPSLEENSHILEKGRDENVNKNRKITHDVEIADTSQLQSKLNSEQLVERNKENTDTHGSGIQDSLMKTNELLKQEVENVTQTLEKGMEQNNSTSIEHQKETTPTTLNLDPSNIETNHNELASFNDIGELTATLPEEPIFIPSYSRWFRMDAIHDIEKRALSEFFTGQYPSKTPEVYMQYRNFTVQSWRADPKHYLTVTALRRHLAGDACAIMRIHAFLEHWGLINYNIDASNRPSPTSFGSPPVIPLASHGSVTSGIPRLLFFDDGSHPDMLDRSVDYRLPEAQMTRRELYATAAAATYYCEICGKDCSEFRYHCISQADMDICPSCFSQGKFPSEFTNDQFVPMKAVSEASVGEETWSENETLLLLEGLEKYGENWDSVAEHVGTKSKESCVLHFIRLPIEDSFLEEQLGKDFSYISREQNKKEDNDVLNSFVSEPFPFADTANPIMAQVAFLASMVSPQVASAAARAALDALTKTSCDSENEKVSQVHSMQSTLESQVGRQATEVMSEQLVSGVNNEANQENKSNLESEEAKMDSVSVQAAAAVALSAAGARGRILAEEESREIERLFAVALESKLKMLHMKMDYFEQMETITRREREKLERYRLQVVADRLSFAYSRVSGKLSESNTIFKVADGQVTKEPLEKEELILSIDSPTEAIPSQSFKKGPQPMIDPSQFYPNEDVSMMEYVEQPNSTNSYLMEDHLLKWNDLQ